ncbi:DUF2336 domain-containing protein [Prosthecomicrobium pneumaticum]|uniref:DUF2336 domain-containing protein n=1 Tax=Prosthecomicrobium pneumaticum TaxID=81895 RepID=A0A7W9FJP2_9HYPH|nr:hypothetical protein [Prosthecomicrobium pneumaticum]
MALALSTGEHRDAALLRAATDLYVQQAAHDLDEQRRFAEMALHFLPKVSARDRAYVADRLADCIDAPPAVLRLLGRDLIEVATPVLLHSAVLSSFDLLAVMAGAGPLHYRLIARRPGLPADVATALRLTGDAETIALLDGRDVPPAEAPMDVPMAETTLPKAAEPAPAAPAAGVAAPSDTASPALAPTAAAPPSGPVSSREQVRAMTADLAAELAALAARPVAPGAVAPAADPAGPAAPQPDRIDADALLRRDSAAIEPRPAARPTESGARTRAEAAFRAASAAAAVPALARQRRRAALIETLSAGLGLSPERVTAMVDDPSGEPLVVLLKAIGLPDAEALKALLLVNDRIGEAVSAFFRLADWQAGLETGAAETLVRGWRGAPSGPRPARHQPVYEEGRPVRGGAAAPARPAERGAAARRERGSGAA